MTRLRSRATLGGAVGGILAGVALAFAIPSAEGVPQGGSWLTPTRPLTVDATPRGSVPANQTSLEVLSEPRLEIRRRDPAGGPDWAVRTFVGRLVTARTNAGGGGRVGATQRCAQLVRVVDGHIGWIDGEHRFRLARAESFNDAPNVCTTTQTPRSYQPQVQAFTLVDLAEPTSPRPLGGVLWGLAGFDAAAVRLTTNGRTIRPNLSARDAYLAFVGPTTDLSDAMTRVRFDDGRVIDAFDERSVMGISVQERRRRTRVDPVVDQPQVVARTYDPGGGASWGVRSARTRGGAWCTGVIGQIVGDLAGTIEPRLGTFHSVSPGTPSRGCLFPTFGGLTKERPVAWTPAWGGPSSTGPASADLRRQSGRTAFMGVAAPGVVSVTIRTRLTVRTVQPSGPARAFIVVYDTKNRMLGPGSSPATLTAHFADGHTQDVKTFGPGI